MPIRSQGPDTENERAYIDEVEQITLGGILTTEGAILDEYRVRGHDFLEARRSDWFDFLYGEHLANRPVTTAGLAERFPKDAVEIWQLTDHGFGQSKQSLNWHAERVRAFGMYRRIWQSTEGIRGMGLEDLNADEILEFARRELDNQAGTVKIKVRRVRETLDAVLDAMDDESPLIPTPWPSLNQLIGGFRPGTLVVVAARPAVGKSVIAAQMAARLAAEGTVAFSSLEMGAEELVSRYLASSLAINLGRIMTGNLTDYDRQLIASRRREVDMLDVAMDDRASVGIGEVAGFARAIAREGRISGLIVDYLQLMSAGAGNNQDRHLVVGEFSRQLKIIAKDLQIPVIALSQLNRKLEDRADGMPRISDLRESGSIEQDADLVILLRREGEFPNERIILDVAKHRQGKTGEVELDWQGMYSRAVELDGWSPERSEAA